MELYTLTPNFLRNEVIDEFLSVIWTERYSSAGEVELIVPLIPEMISKLAPGTFLACDETKEVMILDTYLIEDGTLKITGESLLKFLENRVIRALSASNAREWNFVSILPGELLGMIVQFHCIGGTFMDTPYAVGLDGPNEKIENLALGWIDESGETVPITVPYGPVYEALSTIADTYFMGMRLYLDSADLEGYSLLFSAYRGEDRTTTGTGSLVRLSQQMDSLGEVKELQSIATYKNIAYAFASAIDDPTLNPGIAASGGLSEDLTGFNRRSMMIFCDDIKMEVTEETEAIINDMLEARARDALANNNYIRVVDGEIIPNEFQYGIHYGLGDLIELQSYSGLIQKVRVTEYIRAQDKAGEREYPTVSVVNYEEVTSWIGSD